VRVHKRMFLSTIERLQARLIGCCEIHFALT